MTLRGLTALVAGLALVGGLAVVAFARTTAPPVLLRSDVVAAPRPDVVPTSRGSARTTGVTALDPDWLAETSAATGIPAPALRAYADAQLTVGPGCGLGWTTLAGIGWIESQHGTIGGRTLGEDGLPSSPILGPALDGKGPFAAIPASPESSRWHGDGAWDHAVGPMQFIPSTWATWAADGDRDGRADPHDLDDAALAAARYLCADGHDLSTGPGWTAAVLSYNHAGTYVDAVRTTALEYAARTP